MSPYSIRNGPGRREGILSGFVRTKPGLESQSLGRPGFKIKSPQALPMPAGRPAYLKHEKQGLELHWTTIYLIVFSGSRKTIAIIRVQ
jgi:hypothetical protein